MLFAFSSSFEKRVRGVLVEGKILHFHYPETSAMLMNHFVVRSNFFYKIASVTVVIQKFAQASENERRKKQRLP